MTLFSSRMRSVWLCTVIAENIIFKVTLIESWLLSAYSSKKTIKLKYINSIFMNHASVNRGYVEDAHDIKAKKWPVIILLLFLSWLFPCCGVSAHSPPLHNSKSTSDELPHWRRNASSFYNTDTHEEFNLNLCNKGFPERNSIPADMYPAYDVYIDKLERSKLF